MSLYLLIGTVYMGLMLGFGTCLAFFVGFFAIALFLFFVVKMRIKATRELMSCKDHRISLLKNVLQNISYIKMRGWEMFYSIRVFRLREKELGKLWK